MEKIIKLLSGSNEDIILGMNILKNFSLSEIKNIIDKQHLNNSNYHKRIYHGFSEFKVINHCSFEKRSHIIGNNILIVFQKENFYVFYDSYILGICHPESQYVTHSQSIKI